MDKLFETYANLVAEELLDEARIEFNQLGDNIILISETSTDIDISSYHVKTAEHVLLDVSNISEDNFSIRGLKRAVLGTIDVEQSENPKYNQIKIIAAEKGYGLLLYELAMQQSYPKGIVSDRDGETKTEAFRLYRYYYQGLNPRVRVEELPPEDYDYKPCIDTGNKELECDDDDGVTPNNPQLMQLYNSVLYMKPLEYNILIERGHKFLKDNKHLREKIILAGGEFFKGKYDYQ